MKAAHAFRLSGGHCDVGGRACACPNFADPGANESGSGIQSIVQARDRPGDKSHDRGMREGVVSSDSKWTREQFDAFCVQMKTSK